MLKLRHGVVGGVIGERGGKRIQQKLRALALPALWQKARELDLQNAAIFADLNTLHGFSRTQIFLFFDAGSGIDQVAQPAGDPLGPQRRIRGQHLVVVGITLNIRRVHGIERIVQPFDLSQNRCNSL